MLGEMHHYNRKDADASKKLASAFNSAGSKFTRMMFHQDRFLGS